LPPATRKGGTRPKASLARTGRARGQGREESLTRRSAIAWGTTTRTPVLDAPSLLGDARGTAGECLDSQGELTRKASPGRVRVRRSRPVGEDQL